MNLYLFQYTRTNLADNTELVETVYCPDVGVLLGLIRNWNQAAALQVRDEPRRWEYHLSSADVDVANNPTPICRHRLASQRLDQIEPNRRDAFGHDLRHFWVIIESPELEQEAIKRSRF